MPAASPPMAMRTALCRLRARLLLCLVLCGSLAPAWARDQQDADTLERGIKTAFLYKFVAYVGWPEGTFARPDAPIVIGVMGDDTVHSGLAEVVAGRSVDGHPLSVQRVRSADGLAGIHVLFVARTESARLPTLVKALEDRPVLIVTEADGALGQGSAINFVLANGRVKFDIAPEAAEKRGIKLSSRLLTVAQSLRPATTP